MFARTWYVFPMQCRALLTTKHVVQYDTTPTAPPLPPATITYSCRGFQVALVLHNVYWFETARHASGVEWSHSRRMHAV